MNQKSKCEIHSELSTRYSDSHWWKPGIPIIVIGLGNIGSYLVMLLSKLEPEITLYDMDTLETHNIGVSSYPLSDVGLLKVQAAQKMIKDHSGINIASSEGRYDDQGMTSPITFIGADNMTVRNTAFDMWVEDHGDDPEAMFIDGRSNLELVETYNIQGGNKEAIKKYRESLFSDDEDIGEIPCGAKSSSHFGAIVASLMVTAYTNHLSNIKLGDNIKVIPYSTSFNGLSFDLDKDVSHV